MIVIVTGNDRTELLVIIIIIFLFSSSFAAVCTVQGSEKQPVSLGAAPKRGGGRDISYLVDSTFRKIWAVPKRLIFWSSSMLMFPGIFSSYFPWPFLSRPSAPLATGTVSLERNINSTGNQKQNSRIVNKQLLRNYSHIEFMTSQIDHQ